jgi:DnaK suppressor protein
MTTTLHDSAVSAAQPLPSARTVSSEPMELLRSMLEEQYTLDIARLTQLTVYAALPRHAGYDARSLDVQATSVRQRIAETAQALRRMSEGAYGLCADCHRPIPLGRLRATPHATHCTLCQPPRSY